VRPRLVVLGSTLTALAVARDAHAHGLEPVVVDTHAGPAFRSRYVRSAPVDGANDAALAAHVVALGGPAAMLVATGDVWVRFLMRHRAALDAAYVDLWHPNNDALSLCLSKSRFAQWCAEQKLDAPRSWRAGIDARPAGLAPPFLIRPAETQHALAAHGVPKAVEAKDEAALAHWLTLFADARCEALVAESLLGQPLAQYSVPFARARGVTLSFVARKLRPAPERCAVGTCVALAPHAAAQALAQRAVQALDYHGIGEAEILVNEATGRCALIEINARPWLQYALAPASGHDFIAHLRGTPSTAVPRTTGRCWIDWHSDLFGAFSRSQGAVRRGELALSAYLATLARANVFARFDWRDPAPAFARD
jgi:predicted ATP-grasp superfamily ATP-dependent carboligase